MIKNMWSEENNMNTKLDDIENSITNSLLVNKQTESNVNIFYIFIGIIIIIITAIIIFGIVYFVEL